MERIAFDFIKVKTPITEPTFTKDGLLMPEGYFNVYGTFHNAVVDELENLKFNDFMNTCYSQGVSPTDGFVAWIGEATLIIWITCLKLGYSSHTFWPRTVAAHLLETSQEMLSEMLLSKLNNIDGLTRH